MFEPVTTTRLPLLEGNNSELRGLKSEYGDQKTEIVGLISDFRDRPALACPSGDLVLAGVRYALRSGPGIKIADLGNYLYLIELN